MDFFFLIMLSTYDISRNGDEIPLALPSKVNFHINVSRAMFHFWSKIQEIEHQTLRSYIQFAPIVV